MEYVLLAGAILGNLGGWLVALGLFLERRRLLEKIRGLTVEGHAHLLSAQEEYRANKELRAENERIKGLLAKTQAGSVDEIRGKAKEFVQRHLKGGEQ